MRVVDRKLTWCKEFDKGILVSIDKLNEGKKTLSYNLVHVYTYSTVTPTIARDYTSGIISKTMVYAQGLSYASCAHTNTRDF